MGGGSEDGRSRGRSNRPFPTAWTVIRACRVEDVEMGEWAGVLGRGRGEGGRFDLVSRRPPCWSHI